MLPAHHKATWLALAALLAPGLAAQGQSMKGGYLVDEQLGFKIKPPSKWSQIPTQPDEQWIVGLFQSDREYSNREGYSQKFMMRIIMFDKSPRKEGQDGEGLTDDETTVTIRFSRKLRYRNYREYVKQTLGGGGFFFTAEEERSGKGPPGMMYEVKVDKLAWVKRRLVAWEYERDDVSFAVEFDVYEELYQKLKSTFARTFKSFQFIEVEDPDAAARAANATDEIEITKVDEWKKLSMSERHKRRIAAEERQHEKLRAKLPEDWEVIKTKNFLVISHASPGFTKKIVDIGDACWDYLEDRFGDLSDEYVRRGIIRICRDYEEYRAYHSSSGSFFSFSLAFGSEVEEMNFYEGEAVREQYGYMMRNLFDRYITDKDSELLDEAPYWLTAGISGYLYGCEVKGRRVAFPQSDEGEAAFSKLIDEGGFEGGKLKTPRELMRLTYAAYRELDEAELAPYYQCAHLVRFIEGTGRRNKLLKGRDFLVEYCRAGNEAAAEYEKDHPTDWGSGIKEATTEEEEEAQAAERARLAEERSKAGDVRNRAVIDLLHQKACDWTDDDWDDFTKAYARTCR